MSLLSQTWGGAVRRPIVKEAENELGVMVERTEEWLARGQDQRQLEWLNREAQTALNNAEALATHI